MLCGMAAVNVYIVCGATSFRTLGISLSTEIYELYARLPQYIYILLYLFCYLIVYLKNTDEDGSLLLACAYTHTRVCVCNI